MSIEEELGVEITDENLHEVTVDTASVEMLAQIADRARR